MVHNYTTGPNDSTIYNRYIVQIGATGVLGVIGVTGVLAVTGVLEYWPYIYYIINYIMALGPIETFIYIK